MLSSLSEQDWARLFRECWREAGLAREAERQAVRQGDFAEADYWYTLQCTWREKATALRAGGR